MTSRTQERDPDRKRSRATGLRHGAQASAAAEDDCRVFHRLFRQELDQDPDRKRSRATGLGGEFHPKGGPPRRYSSTTMRSRAREI